jgi:regulation of enolase protein 1 (concanavalin A-like superfamily)
MKTITLLDPAFSWTRESNASIEAAKSSVSWSCLEGSDYWRLTASGLIAHNGHACVVPVERGFSLAGNFSSSLRFQYDQAGLIAIKTREEWFKGSFELDGQIYVGGVHTRGTSDWSRAPAPTLGSLRLERQDGTLMLSWRLQHGEWSMIRQLTLEGSLLLGYYSAAPLGSGFRTTLSDFHLEIEE